MTDNTLLKANLLGGMNSYILDVVGDEELTEIWFREGIPDECDEDTLMETAENEDEFLRISYLFGVLINDYKG